MRNPYDIFLQIVESGSISKACAALNMSQPALSKQLRRLEDELKVKLLERSSNGIKLTPYGAALVAPAHAMRSADHSARMTIERLRQSFQGHAVFGTTPPIAVYIMPQVAMDLFDESPGLKLTIMEAQPAALLDMVRRGDIEFAICASNEEPLPDDLGAQPLFNDTRIVVAAASHEIFRSGRIELPSLLEASWILPHMVLSAWLEESFSRLGLVPPPLRIETSSIAQTIKLLESGKFISSMPVSTIPQQLIDKSVLPVLPELLFSKIAFKAIYRAGAALSPAARLVFDCVAETGQSVFRNPELAAYG